MLSARPAGCDAISWLSGHRRDEINETARRRRPAPGGSRSSVVGRHQEPLGARGRAIELGSLSTPVFVTRARRRCLAVLVATLATSSALVAPAHGHSSFLESTPRPGARLSQSPKRIVMVYTEPLNGRLTRVRLLSAQSGKPLPSDVRVAEGRRLEVAPRGPLPRGAYRLDWRSVSTIDGHIREGSIGFGVRTASLGAPIELQQNPLAGAGPVRATLRWLFYLALFFFAGGALNAMLLARNGTLGSWLAPAGRSAFACAGADPQGVVARAARRTARAGALAAAAAMIVAVFEAADAAGGLDVARMRDFLLGGLAGYARMLTVAALVGAALAARRRAIAPAALLVAVALYGVALGGHASGADMRAIAVGTDWIHLLAAALWAGGVAQLAWAWGPALRTGGTEVRRTVISTVLPRFGRVALPAFVVMAATGSINALIELGALNALWNTAYGRVLAVKVVLVGAAAALSYVHAFHLRARLAGVTSEQQTGSRIHAAHRRALRAQAPLGAVVLAAAALLVAFPVPPREVQQAVAASAAAKVLACRPCPLPKPAEDELAVGAAAGRLTVAAWLRKQGTGIAATIRVLDTDRRPAGVAINVAGARSTTPCGTGCWRVRLAAQPKTLALVITDLGNRSRVELPAVWRAGDNDRARRILMRTQRRMRALRTLRQLETGQSAAADTAVPKAHTQLEFQAPDRTRYRSAAAAGVIIGRRVWFRGDRVLGWQALSKADESFRMRDGFRWTVFAETVRLLGTGQQDGHRVAHLALVDWGYPVWYELTVDLDRGYALDATLTTPENRLHDSYTDFNAPLEIREPETRRR